ncbi:MAG: hypothetical protein M1817_001911 [Caeruleum heppii]|nr:MAG: hypothetical protein M1817_001911 [Caeruleum heppii]
MHRLSTRRPSPTTVEFTVSTLTTHTVLSSHFLRSIALLLRVCCGLLLILVNYTKWHLRHGSPTNLTHQHITKPAIEDRLYLVAITLPWRFLLPLTLAVGYLIVRRGYTEESLLVLRGLGIQTSTSSATYLSTSTTRFIPTNLIQDIFIHEAFKGFEVRFYLAVVVEAEEEVVVVFPKLLPQRKVVEQVWRETRACLYESKA